MDKLKNKIRWSIGILIILVLIALRIGESLDEERSKELLLKSRTQTGIESMGQEIHPRGARKLNLEEIENAIRSGDLSDHEAMFYHSLETKKKEK